MGQLLLDVSLSSGGCRGISSASGTETKPIFKVGSIFRVAHSNRGAWLYVFQRGNQVRMGIAYRSDLLLHCIEQTVLSLTVNRLPGNLAGNHDSRSGKVQESGDSPLGLSVT